MDDRVIGQICLQPLPELSEIGVGYGLEPSFWGRGFAEEALNEVLRYAWEDKRLKSVVALVRPENFRIEPALPVEDYFDGFGNHCGRVDAPAGVIRFLNDAVIRDPGELDA